MKDSERHTLPRRKNRDISLAVTDHVVLAGLGCERGEQSLLTSDLLLTADFSPQDPRALHHHTILGHCSLSTMEERFMNVYQDHVLSR